MNRVHCYRLLGLNSTAGLEEIKASYRRLARQYHPDFNQNNPQAQNHFIRLTEAYQFLKEIFPPDEINLPHLSHSQNGDQVSTKTANFKRKKPNSFLQNETTDQQPFAKINFDQNTNRNYEKNTEQDQKLKWQCYDQLRTMMKEKRFARAITLVEGLSYRLPYDPEVRQWQAIVYQHQGKQFLQQKQIQKAKTYFQKALRTDLYNRILQAEIQKDLAIIK